MKRNRPPRQRNNERGSTMLIVTTILIALLAGGGVALFLQLESVRSSGNVKQSRDALYCAEAGLVEARLLIGSQFDTWALLLDADDTNDPAWYPIQRDMDGDGNIDYTVTVRDNEDEFPTPNPLVDNDASIFVVSTCVKNAEMPRSLVELVRYEGGGMQYRNQSGQGAGNTGNVN